MEVTLEANPGTIERGRFAEYRAAGVTRVSLGAQSFDARQLKLLGRIHSADETRRAAEELHAAGLTNFNLDLMYALPGQSAEEAEADVRAALALAPTHVSQYHLTIEPGTVFAAAPPTQPADEIVEEMLARSLQSLAAAGFEQYEVSGYARAGARCRHNLNYWTFGDYLGIGAGAHGKISYPSRDLVVRTQQTREPRRYLAAEPGALIRKPIAIRDLPFEFAMNGFRLVEGFQDELFSARTGLPSGILERALAPLVTRGLVDRGERAWRATPAGFRFLNDILVELLPEAETAGAA
jgi:oxygen-independent coproporphyrinogen-3 oxidase